MNEEPKPRSSRCTPTGPEYHFEREEAPPDADKDPAVFMMIVRGLRLLLDQLLGQTKDRHD